MEEEAVSDKYLLTEVALCTFTFSDGEQYRITPPVNTEVVMVKLISRMSKSAQLEECALKNYLSVKTASELARLCGYDCVKTFSRHFKKYLGETPYQWMLDRKMEEVQAQVLGSDLSISKIAEMYGFRSVSHLVNNYTKRFGFSPYKSRIDFIEG